MKFWYLDHSGFLVETEKHLLVFDYYTDVPRGGTLQQGVVTPALLPEDKQLCVFVSHSHYDHYNKVVHSWKQERPDTLLFMGEDIPLCADAVRVPCGGTVREAGLSVTALRSTDAGAAFLVTVDGQTVYHAGDLNWWRWDGEPEEQNDRMAQLYQREVDTLRGTQIDLAFLPVDPRLGGSAFLGARYFMEAVGAAHMVPMHLWGKYETCGRLAADPGSAAFADRIVPISRRGESFTL